MMTIKETKAWLNRAYKLNEEIDEMERAKKTMWYRATSVIPNYDGTIVNGSIDPHKYEKYVEYCELVDSRIDELYDIKREIQASIERVDTPTHRALLIARYINFRTFEQIAVDMNYSWRNVMYLHKDALLAISKKLA